MMQRLTTRAQFQAVMAGGVCSRTPHFVLHRLLLAPQLPPTESAPLPAKQAAQALFFVPGAQPPWLGPLVPKRWARRSVTRHLLRRQIYAVAADFADQLPPQAAYVVRLRAAFERKQFISASSEPLRQAIRAELQHLFAYAARKAATVTATATATATALPATSHPPQEAP